MICRTGRNYFLFFNDNIIPVQERRCKTQNQKDIEEILDFIRKESEGCEEIEPFLYQLGCVLDKAMTYRDIENINLIVVFRYHEDVQRFYLGMFYRDDNRKTYIPSDELNCHIDFTILKYNYQSTLSNLIQSIELYLEKVQEIVNKRKNISIDEIKKKFGLEEGEGGEMF